MEVNMDLDEKVKEDLAKAKHNGRTFEGWEKSND